MARRDQAISYHQVSEARYELSGLRTGSVRDQMFRAHLLVTRLISSGRLSPGDDLLIFGAGVAGVTSALTACTYGVNVALLETNQDAFETQRNVHSRWLDPTEFDWPQPHWTTQRMGAVPAGYVDYPLVYTAGKASTLAIAWKTNFEDVLYGRTVLKGRLEFYTGVDARSLVDSTSLVDVVDGIEIAWPGARLHRRPDFRLFRLAISCIGFGGEKGQGGERVAFPSSSGPHGGAGPLFWFADRIENRRLGLSLRVTGRAHALISGAGDGAQQDFLRVLTGLFGRRLADKLGISTSLNSLNLTEILQQEDYGRRAHAWSGESDEVPSTLARWQDAYNRLADQIWATWSGRGAISTMANRVLRPDTEATLLLKCEAPTYSYGLNRLLVLLVGKLHAHQSGRPLSASDAAGDSPGSRAHRHGRSHAPIFLYGYKLSNLDSTSHRCGPGCNIACPHDAEIVGEMTGNKYSVGPFDFVIIRHGIDQQPLFRPGAPIPEQMVAYDIPN